MSKSDKSKESKARVFLGRDAWTQHVSDYRKSGLTLLAYANEHKLNSTTFRNWITRLKRESRIPSSLDSRCSAEELHGREEESQERLPGKTEVGQSRTAAQGRQ